MTVARSGMSPAVAMLLVALTALTAAAVTAAVTTRAPATSATTRTVVVPRPDVLRAVRDLARLESVSFHMERVIDLREAQTRALGLVQAEDAILLVAVGEVVAGVDLGRLGPDDVVWQADRRAVTLTLPAPEVFSSNLDAARTYVHHRSTDLLARRQESLETRARQEASRAIRAAALEAGLLARAQRNAETTLRGLLGSMGVAEVTLRWRAP